MIRRILAKRGIIGTVLLLGGLGLVVIYPGVGTALTVVGLLLRASIEVKWCGLVHNWRYTRHQTEEWPAVIEKRRCLRCGAYEYRWVADFVDEAVWVRVQ